MKEAVCALIFTSSGKILSVSRKDNPDLIGLVGGKVDDGETREQALVRETFEETGLTVTHFKKIFEGIDGEFKTFTYLCNVKGTLTTKEAGVIKEVTWDELFNGPFGDYNRQLFEAYRTECQFDKEIINENL